MIRTIPTRKIWTWRTTVFVVILASMLVSIGLLAPNPAHAVALTVSNTVDPGDGSCNPNGGCTLREAINEANQTTADTIRFDIDGEVSRPYGRPRGSRSSPSG